MFEGNRASPSANDIDVFLFGTAVELKDNVSKRAGGVLDRKTVRYPTQSANSFVFGTVAERRIMLTWSGNIMMTSSQTTPRYQSHIPIA